MASGARHFRGTPLTAAWPLLACFGGLLLLDLGGLGPAAARSAAGADRAAGALFLAVLLLAFGAFFFALKRLGSAGALRRGRAESPVTGILAVALLLRLLALPLPPSLSDDVYRYLWDGRVAAAGENPYRLAPNHPDLADLRGALWQRTAHRDVATVYPPLALGLFAAASMLPWPLMGYKLALVAADLIGCGLLLALARRRGSAAAAAAYAWNPLVVIEGAGMGHVDVLGVSLAIACVALIADRRGSLPATPSAEAALAAGIAAALGALAKLVPLAAIPLWWRALRQGRSRRRLFALSAAGLLVPAAAAVLVWTGGVPPGLAAYALRWEYNGPLYEPLWRLLDLLHFDRAAGAIVHAARATFGGEAEAQPWATLSSGAYPQFLARAMLAAAGLAAWLGLWRRGRGRRGLDPVRAAFAAFGIVLLASPTLYPWYLIWLLPWVALLWQPVAAARTSATGCWQPVARSVLLLSATLPLAYLPSLVGIDYFPWVYGAVWLPPLLLFAASRRRAGDRR